MKQHEAVIQTLERLGGLATLGQLNQEVFKIKDCEWKTKTPFASIRRIVQLNPEIYKIKPGLYGLLSMKKLNETKGIIAENSKNKNSKEIIEFNHSYYQGILIHFGNSKGLHTFIPNQDKNKLFLTKKLGDLRTLDSIPPFTYPEIVQRSSTVDVIWFNNWQMPHSLFEVEHSTDIQNSLLKFTDLRDFSARMLIVADKMRKIEYSAKIKYHSFKDISNRVSFLDYDSLLRQYEFQLEQQSFSVIV